MGIYHFNVQLAVLTPSKPIFSVYSYHLMHVCMYKHMRLIIHRPKVCFRPTKVAIPPRPPPSLYPLPPPTALLLIIETGLLSPHAIALKQKCEGSVHLSLRRETGTERTHAHWRAFFKERAGLLCVRRPPSPVGKRWGLK